MISFRSTIQPNGELANFENVMKTDKGFLEDPQGTTF